MKKLMSIIVSILFALSLSGLAFAQAKPGAPAPETVKTADERAPAKAKKADKKAKKSKKAKKAAAKVDKNDPEGAGK